MPIITYGVAWVYRGKPYLKQIDAVKAALEDIARAMYRDYATNPLQGLLAHGEDVSMLRQAYLELLDAEGDADPSPTLADTQTEATSETVAGEPL